MDDWFEYQGVDYFEVVFYLLIALIFIAIPLSVFGVQWFAGIYMIGQLYIFYLIYQYIKAPN